jgi:hypothetical protein
VKMLEVSSGVSRRNGGWNENFAYQYLRYVNGSLTFRKKNLFSSLCVQTGSGAHPASWRSFLGVKARPGRDADRSPLSSAEFKNE